MSAAQYNHMGIQLQTDRRLNFIKRVVSTDFLKDLGFVCLKAVLCVVNKKNYHGRTVTEEPAIIFWPLCNHFKPDSDGVMLGG
jgi:hypothetical protein